MFLKGKGFLSHNSVHHNSYWTEHQDVCRTGMLLGALEKNPFLCLFSFQSLPAFFGLWLCSFILKASNVASSNLSLTVCLTVFLLPPFSTYQDPNATSLHHRNTIALDRPFLSCDQTFPIPLFLHLLPPSIGSHRSYFKLVLFSFRQHTILLYTIITQETLFTRKQIFLRYNLFGHLSSWIFWLTCTLGMMPLDYFSL